MELINKKINGKEYTLVEVYNEKEDIYHFVCDDKEIFCFKKGEKYIVIKDKILLKKIRQKYGLLDNKDEIYYTARPILVSTVLLKIFI